MWKMGAKCTDIVRKKNMLRWLLNCNCLINYFEKNFKVQKYIASKVAKSRNPSGRLSENIDIIRIQFIGWTWISEIKIFIKQWAAFW